MSKCNPQRPYLLWTAPVLMRSTTKVICRTCRCVRQAEFGDDALKQLRKREAAERRAAAESQMDANLIPLGERPVRLRHRVGFSIASQYRFGSAVAEALPIIEIPCRCRLNICSLAVTIAFIGSVSPTVRWREPAPTLKAGTVALLR